MSKTTCTYPMIGAVAKAIEYLHGKEWGAVNDDQKKFLKDFYNVGLGEVQNMKELETRASTIAKELNAWLKERNFSIKLEEFGNGMFGVVSILDVLVEWKEKGSRRKLDDKNDVVRDAVFIKDDYCSVFTSGTHRHPIVEIKTKSNDLVYITIADDELEGFSLVERVNKLQSSLKPTWGFSGVVFPMVELNQEVDIGWLKSMATTDNKGNEWVIAQALQQTKFRMNEEGARAESAVAVSMKRCAASMKPAVTIDKPFFIWISRPGLSNPLFVGYIDEQDWKDPKSLK